MALKMIGKVYSIGATQVIASKNGGQPFSKRELVLDATRFDGLTGERGYDNFPLFEFGGEKCADLDGFKPGDVVEVSFELQGSFYKDKDGIDRNFTRIRAYKVEPYSVRQKQPQKQPQPQVAQQPQYQAAPQPQYPPQQTPPSPGLNDLPFPV